MLNIQKGEVRGDARPRWFTTVVTTSPLPDWYARLTHLLQDGRRVFITLVCPQGHHSCVSARVHRIGPDGSLSPSYVCPAPGCTFHVFARLDGWLW